MPTPPDLTTRRPSSGLLAVTATSLRLLLADPAPVLLMMAMPLLLAPFLAGGAEAQLRLAGDARAPGADQVVPGLAVMFAFMSTQLVGTLFFREHAWGTWARLRAGRLSTLDLVLGKVAPLYLTQVLQTSALLGLGALLLGYRPRGPIAALAVIVLALSAMITAYAVLLVALFRTMDLALVVGNLGGLVMSGLGGALTPVSALPHWAQGLAHASPAYWALDALGRVTLHGAGLGGVAGPLGVIAGITAACVVVTAWRFRAGDTKIGTT